MLLVFQWYSSSIDSSGGCIGLLPPDVIQTFPITPVSLSGPQIPTLAQTEPPMESLYLTSWE